jgi:hypothetical protein
MIPSSFGSVGLSIYCNLFSPICKEFFYTFSQKMQKIFCREPKFRKNGTKNHTYRLFPENKANAKTGGVTKAQIASANGKAKI